MILFEMNSTLFLHLNLHLCLVKMFCITLVTCGSSEDVLHAAGWQLKDSVLLFYIPRDMLLQFALVLGHCQHRGW